MLWLAIALQSFISLQSVSRTERPTTFVFKASKVDVKFIYKKLTDKEEREKVLFNNASKTTSATTHF